jgi:hypothetical protein
MIDRNMKVAVGGSVRGAAMESAACCSATAERHFVVGGVVGTGPAQRVAEGGVLVSGPMGTLLIVFDGTCAVSAANVL